MHPALPALIKNCWHYFI